ncbi:hypothetical protein SLEP1_g50264 [Rubroshorea leprosula]|uniref:Uncharacterized protein n=1 Tax=Rubroshorea leprosula TaxID=152421 RepID=A0AAV5LZE7_9ROSI|nr:hypothetical protein SLEP1_g50264 [Rubroshorea leprosula]
MSSSSEKYFRHDLRVLLLLFLLLLAKASVGGCIRPMVKVRNLQFKFEEELPRAPVPPSGPSACHNTLGPYNEPPQFWQPDDDDDDDTSCP